MADLSQVTFKDREHSNGGGALPVHMLTIVALGINLFDNADLEALAETAASLGRWEFLLIAGVLPVVGGTGSPINALALF